MSELAARPRPLHVLSFCSGVGGLDLGLRLALGDAVRTVAFIEREGYCASVLRARMQDGCLDECPIWSDVKTFDAQPWRGRVDCITAGYPCQPFSTAGRRKGAEDPRHLWPHIARHIAVLRPAYVFCENVPGHLSLGFDEVSAELSEMGYGVEAGIFSAAEVGAPHLRKRLFFLAVAADADVQQSRQLWRGAGTRNSTGSVYLEGYGENRAMADTQHGVGGTKCPERQPLGGQYDGLHAERPQDSGRPAGGSVARCAGPTKPSLGRAFDGNAAGVDELAWRNDWERGVSRVTQKQPHRVDRLRALGNAVVPQTAALAWKTLWAQAHAKREAACG